jgi:hypothetical protein
MVVDRFMQHDWDALTPEERSLEYELFEHLCSQGIGNTHRFYPILMRKALAGYVGD